MAPRNKPRWNEFGFTDYPGPPPFLFNEDEIAKLAARLGVSETDQREKLANQLNTIADTHLEALEEGKVTPSQGEINAALEAMLKSTQDLLTKLRDVDHKTRDYFWEEMADNPYKRERGLPQESYWEQYQELGGRLGHFESTLGRCLEESIKPCGRPVNTILKSTIKDLINLYEEFSGQPFTHTSHVGGKYNGNPQSDGGQFVEVVIKNIDVNITSSNVTSILAEHIRNRNRNNLP